MHTQNTRTNFQVKKYKIQFVNNCDRHKPEEQRTHTLKVYSWVTVNELKTLISKQLNYRKENLRLFYKTNEMGKKQNNATLDSFGIKKGVPIQVYEKKDYQGSKGDIYAQPIFRANSPYQEQQLEKLQEKFKEIESGFKEKIYPKLTDDGTSGSYFLLSDVKKNIAIFKPRDEEAYAPNNPRGYTGKMGQMGFRRGILSGESATREVAAYILDFYTSQGRHGVPITTYVEFYHPSFNVGDLVDNNNNNNDQLDEYTQTNKKNQQVSPTTQSTKSSIGSSNIINNNNSNNPPQQQQEKKKYIKHGSLQIFEKHQGVVGDYGSGLFKAEDVHKIGILDIRILNCDRNEENILIGKKSVDETGKIQVKNLIPIDHGLSLPSSLEIMDYEIVWMSWPAAKEPFSEANLDFIASIDIDQQVELLKKHLKFEGREICLRNFKIANMVLKKYAAKGYSLFQIGQIVYREDDEKPSPLEEVVEWAEKMYRIKKKMQKKSKQSEIEETLLCLKKNSSNISKNSNNNNINKNYQCTQQIQEEDEEEKEKDQQQPQQLKKHIKSEKISQSPLTLKRSTSLPNLEQENNNNSESQEDEEQDENNNNNNNNKQMQNGTNHSSVNYNQLKQFGGKRKGEEEWDEMFYQCVENAFDNVIGAKNKDIPKLPEFIQKSSNESQGSSKKRSRFMSEDFKL